MVFVLRPKVVRLIQESRGQVFDSSLDQRPVPLISRLCWWLEELRYSYNTLYCLQPGEDYETSENVEGIVINSGYRSPAVNKLAGGVPTSNHVTGCAVDIRCVGKEQMIRYASILLDIADGTGKDYDELLLEQHGNICWLHFAVRPPGQQNRRKISFLRP